jgi:hypothetical protein
MYDPTDHRGVPVSKGIPHAVRWAAAVGMIAIFAMGFLTIIQASYGHVWPEGKSLRLDLSQPK